jgi:hypothetical protein
MNRIELHVILHSLPLCNDLCRRIDPYKMQPVVANATTTRTVTYAQCQKVPFTICRLLCPLSIQNQALEASRMDGCMYLTAINDGLDIRYSSIIYI